MSRLPPACAQQFSILWDSGNALHIAPAAPVSGDSDWFEEVEEAREYAWEAGHQSRMRPQISQPPHAGSPSVARSESCSPGQRGCSRLTSAGEPVRNTGREPAGPDPVPGQRHHRSNFRSRNGILSSDQRPPHVV